MVSHLLKSLFSYHCIFRAVIKFWVNCSVDLHTSNKLVIGLIVSAIVQFTHNIKGLLNIQV